MDVSVLRQQILRALDEARKHAASKREAADHAREAYETFLRDVAAPVFLQAANVLRALRQEFVVHTPAGSVRLEGPNAQEFIELELDAGGAGPQVMGRTGLMRHKGGPLVEERPVAPGKSIEAVTEDDVATFLTTEIPRLVMRA